MRAVRQARAGNETKFIGRNYLSPEQTRAITEAISSSGFVAAMKQAAQADLPVNKLAERFEEMARREGMTVDAELRPAVVKLLAAELWTNQRALGTPAERLISATIHQGAIAPELLNEFPEYPQYFVTQAVVHNPGAPRTFIHRALEKFRSLSSDPEFEEIARNRPSDVLDAVLSHPSKAQTELRRRAIKTGYGPQNGAEKK